MAESAQVHVLHQLPETPQETKTAIDLEKEAEKRLAAKYGGLMPKKNKLLVKEHNKHFDSADWALEMQGKKTGELTVNPEPLLPPKLEPTVVPPRRVSKLG